MTEYNKYGTYNNEMSEEYNEIPPEARDEYPDEYGMMNMEPDIEPNIEQMNQPYQLNEEQIQSLATIQANPKFVSRVVTRDPVNNHLRAMALWKNDLATTTPSADKGYVRIRARRHGDATAAAFKLMLEGCYTRANLNSTILYRLTNHITVASYAGSVSSFSITNQGSGYGTTAPTVTVSAPSLPIADGGIQATAAAVLGTGGSAGKVVSISIVNPGYGYKYTPTVSIAAPPVATGAVRATAVVRTSVPTVDMYTDKCTGTTNCVPTPPTCTVTAQADLEEDVAPSIYDTTIPSQIPDLEASPTLNSLDIVWSKPLEGTGNVFAYYVRISSAAGVIEEGYVSASTTRVAKTGLSSGKTYTVEVAALSKSGVRGASNIVVATTQAVPTPCPECPPCEEEISIVQVGGGLALGAIAGYLLTRGTAKK